MILKTETCSNKKFIFVELKTLVLFILILILMRLMALMQDLVLFLLINRPIFMTQNILILKILVAVQFLIQLRMVGLLKIMLEFANILEKLINRTILYGLKCLKVARKFKD